MQIGKWNITIKDFVWLIVCLLLVLCFFVGVLFRANAYASAVLSGASTAVSIVLSVVAILYTMIEGANSSKINQDSINRLSSIDLQLKQLTKKTIEQRELDQRLRSTISKLDITIQQMEESSKKSRNEFLDQSTAENIQSLLNYIKEDIDE